MPPEVEARFERIESLLHAMAERENQMEERAQAMEQRWLREHQRDMASTKARMDAFDKKLDGLAETLDRSQRQIVATRNLVRAGVKFVTKLSIEVDKLRRMQQAMLRPNGNGHSSRN